MDHYLRPRDHERSAKILTYITGVVLCLMIGLVIIGGIKKESLDKKSRESFYCYFMLLL